MTVLKTSRVLRVAISTSWWKSASSDDVSFTIVQSYEIPKVFFTYILFMIIVYVWRTVKSCHSKGHPTTNDVLVVTMELGKGFFHKRSPEGLIIANMTEDSGVSTIPNVFFEWKIIVNNLGVRNTQGIEVESINARIVDVCILNDSIKSLWILSKSCGRSQVPAIAN